MKSSIFKTSKSVLIGFSFFFFLFNSCEKEESNDANDTGSYDCVSGDCVAAKGGTYGSLSACQNACGGTGNAETYDCINGNCVGAGDNGTYGNLSSCQNSCSGVTQYEDQRDGEVYQLAEINGRIWMAENMRYNIPSGDVWPVNNNNPSFVNQFGRLYAWNTAVQVCPTGWRLPLRDEVEDLINYLQNNSLTGAALKQNSWGAPLSGTTYNETGFSALPAGLYYFPSSLNEGTGEEGIFWTSSEAGNAEAFVFSLSRGNEDLLTANVDVNFGFSCRCILD